jgi:phosphoglycerate kinase
VQTLTAPLIQNKKVLLRLDLDVPIAEGKVADDFRLLAGLDTLDFCLAHAQSVVVMGHLGRPSGEDPSYSVKPVVDWFEERFAHISLPAGKLHILENLRFEAGEDSCSLDFAKELASLGEVFINEAFASHHPSASTTVLPTLLPHAAGFTFQKEVEVLSQVRSNPDKPLVAIIGGAKLEDKMPAVLSLAKIADVVLVGGKIALEMKLQEVEVPGNVMLGKLNELGTDLAPSTTDAWKNLIAGAKEIVWNGPVGKFEDERNGETKVIAKMILENTQAKTILGGGDTITAVSKYGQLGGFSFVSTGGGAMLEFLIQGTLPTIEVLN